MRKIATKTAATVFSALAIAGAGMAYVSIDELSAD
jgi:hypothetical protein